MKKAGPPKVEKFPGTKQRRLDLLLEKNSSGTITAKEKARLLQLVSEAEKLMAANARRLADFTRRQTARVPPHAMPVTVWVQPQLGER
jgi:uncharacterized FlgJ-related protein